MRTEKQEVALKRRRILFAPVGMIGLACIWLYVLATTGKEHADYTFWKILDL